MAQSISGLLRDPSEDDFENNRQKQLNTNSRAVEMSMGKCTQKYVLTMQKMVSRDACSPGLVTDLSTHTVWPCDTRF